MFKRIFFSTDLRPLPMTSSLGEVYSFVDPTNSRIGRHVFATQAELLHSWVSTILSKSRREIEKEWLTTREGGATNPNDNRDN